MSVNRSDDRLRRSSGYSSPPAAATRFGGEKLLARLGSGDLAGEPGRRRRAASSSSRRARCRRGDSRRRSRARGGARRERRAHRPLYQRRRRHGREPRLRRAGDRASAQGWLVALADMPWIAPATIARVAAAIADGAPVAAPVPSRRAGPSGGIRRGVLRSARRTDGRRGRQNSRRGAAGSRGSHRGRRRRDSARRRHAVGSWGERGLVASSGRESRPAHPRRACTSRSCATSGASAHLFRDARRTSWWATFSWRPLPASCPQPCARQRGRPRAVGNGDPLRAVASACYARSRFDRNARFLARNYARSGI